MQQRCRTTALVVVADREADIHEVCTACAQTPHGAQLLIRAERSRTRKGLTDDETCEFLWTILEQQSVIGTREILIPPSEQRAARQATLAVRTAPVTRRPPTRKRHVPAVRVWAVLAREVDPPADVEGLEWMLLTTVEVQDAAHAYERLEWYARRWSIEVYHRILKSGGRVEARQLETARRLQNCLAIDMIVAWRIHHLTALGRGWPAGHGSVVARHGAFGEHRNRVRPVPLSSDLHHACSRKPVHPLVLEHLWVKISPTLLRPQETVPGTGEDLRFEVLSVPRHLACRGRDGCIHPFIITAIQPEHRSPDEMVVGRLDRRAAVVDDGRLQVRLRHGVRKARRPAPAEPERRDPAGGRGQCDRMVAHRVEPRDRVSRLERADEPDDLVAAGHRGGPSSIRSQPRQQIRHNGDEPVLGQPVRHGAHPVGQPEDLVDDQHHGASAEPSGRTIQVAIGRSLPPSSMSTHSP